MNQINVTPMIEALATEYASKRKALEEAQTEVDALAERVRDELGKLNLKTYETEHGTFTRMTRKSVEWSKGAELELATYLNLQREAKKRLLEEGKGTEIESESLRFQPTKK